MSKLNERKPLVTKKPLKASPKPKKQKKPTRTLLRRKSDELFSKYIRLRDSDYRRDVEVPGWYGKCITCSYNGLVAWIDDKDDLRFTRGWDAGHFVSRGNWFVRYDEENVNLQCSYRCNKMKSGEHIKYGYALEEKYGRGTPKHLEESAEKNKEYTLKIEEFQQIIEDSKNQIAWYRIHAVGD